MTDARHFEVVADEAIRAGKPIIAGLVEELTVPPVTARCLRLKMFGACPVCREATYECGCES